MKWHAGEYNVELDGEKLYIGDSPKLTYCAISNKLCENL